MESEWMAAPHNLPVTSEEYERYGESPDWVIKEHCPVCSKIYLGEHCRCQSHKRVRSPRCDCGSKAVEVLLNDLGEWPLCKRCLAVAVASVGQEMVSEDQQDDPVSASSPAGSGMELPPYNLTWRQYQIARMAHLSNPKIAEALSISPETVKSHMCLILKKLGARSRHQVPGMLAAAIRRQAVRQNRTAVLQADPQDGLTVVFFPWDSIDRLPPEIRDLLQDAHYADPQETTKETPE